MSDEKKLPAQVQNRNLVQLHDSGLQAGSLVQQALTRLNEQQAQDLMVKAGEVALELEKKNREQNMDYDDGKKRLEDHIDAFNMLDKSKKLTVHKLITESKSATGSLRVESKSGATCFVASVAYDDPNHPDVMFLRGFRDNILSQSKSGRSFIGWYWVNGPRLAKIVGKSFALRKAAKFVISRIVGLLR